MVADMVSMGCFGRYGEFDKFSTMAVTVDGKLVGGTVYHNYQPEAGVIELSSYSRDPRWLSRVVVNHMFHFPFALLGCQMVVLRVARSNVRMRRIAQRFGFKEHYIPRLRGRDEGEFIYTFTDDAWEQHHLRDKGFSVTMPA